MAYILILILFGCEKVINDKGARFINHFPYDVYIIFCFRYKLHVNIDDDYTSLHSLWIQPGVQHGANSSFVFWNILRLFFGYFHFEVD